MLRTQDLRITYWRKPKFLAVIDLTKIKPAPTHYIGKAGDERIADLVFQCPTKDGSGNVMVVIVFEHQSGSLKKIPRKLLRYISAIWDAETKEGKKVLSAPYFIVLRTAKKPHRGAYPTMADSLPKDRDGNPLGKVVEIEYDVVDLPAWNFDRLVGGPALCSALRMLKKMVEGFEDEFPEALAPLLEIADEELQIELLKELLQFAQKVFAAHNRRLDEAKMREALNPILHERGRTMIKTAFEETYDKGFAKGKTAGKAEGKAEGKTEGKAETLLRVLRVRFHRVPKEIEKMIQAMKDPTVLDSYTELAVTCQSLAEFKKSLH